MKEIFIREEVIQLLTNYTNKHSTMFLDTDKKTILNKYIKENL